MSANNTLLVTPATPTRRPEMEAEGTMLVALGTPAHQPIIPLFTPRTPRTGVWAPTPESDMESDDEAALSLAHMPKGHQLIVRSCVSSDLTKTPSSLVKKFLTSLGNKPQFDYFKKLHLVVSPFSDRASNVSSAYYVEIRPRAGEANTEPRVDILEIILSAIAVAKPEWEARWSASRKGKSDKHMSSRLLGLYPGITDRSKVPAEHLPIVWDHVKKMGFRVASVFASFGGPQIFFLLPMDADRFAALGSIDVPSKVSKPWHI